MKKKLKLSAIAVAIAMVMTGCSSGGSNYIDGTSTDLTYEASDPYNSYATKGNYSSVNEDAYGIDYENQNKKLVRTVTIKIESDNPDSTDSFICDTMMELGGYYEDHNCDNYYSRGYDMTIRMPRENVDDFITFLNSMDGSTVKSCSDSVVDKSMEYIDTEALKDNLIIERDTLQDLLTQATEVSDIIEIQDRLTDISYRLDSAERQLRSIDDKVYYSTIYLYIDATHKYQEVGWGQKFIDSWSERLETAGDIVITFITSIPVIIVSIPFIFVIGIVFGVFVKAVKFITRIRFKGMKKKQDTTK